jgi:hypothetical protein
MVTEKRIAIDRIKASTGNFKRVEIAGKSKNKIETIAMFERTIILSENLIRLTILLCCLFSKYSGINFCKAEEKPKKLIEDKRRAKFIEVATTPACPGNKNLPTINQKIRPNKLTANKSKKR